MQRKKFFNIIITLCVFISIYILLVGYMLITSEPNIIKEDYEENYEDIYIKNVRYLSNNEANLERSEIIGTFGTVLHSKIYLSEINEKSQIEYEIELYNNSNQIKKFVDIVYSNKFYSNEFIKFKVEGITGGDIIGIGEEKKVSIIFYYENLQAGNKLDSYLNFEFE